MSDKVKVEPSTSKKMLSTLQINLDDVDDFSKVCRTCATVSDEIIPIFDGDGLLNNLAEKIQKHLPIDVGPTDTLPQGVCPPCGRALVSWHELVTRCRLADRALRRRASCGRLPTPMATVFGLSKQDQTSGNGQQKMYNLAVPKTIKGLIVDYCEKFLLNEDYSDMKYVCQKCEARPAYTTVDKLAQHLETSHLPEILGTAAVELFIMDHITFEETLLLDNSDMDSDSDMIKIPTLKKLVLENFCCPFCSSIFSTVSRLINHLSQHKEASIDAGFNCCDTVYKDKNDFVKHLQNTHMKTDREILIVTCRTCGFKANSTEDLKAHVTAKHRDTNRKNKKNNKQGSGNQRDTPAECPKCHKMFSNKYHMLFHAKRHTEADTYACDKCDKSYSTKGNLTAHKKIKHDGILKFLCSFCGEAFEARQTRDNHLLLHTNGKPFICDCCGQSFRSKHTLSRHLEVHFDVRNYSCTMCERKFRRKTHLDYHIRTHKTEPPKTEQTETTNNQ